MAWICLSYIRIIALILSLLASTEVKLPPFLNHKDKIWNSKGTNVAWSFQPFKRLNMKKKNWWPLLLGWQLCSYFWLSYDGFLLLHFTHFSSSSPNTQTSLHLWYLHQLSEIDACLIPWWAWERGRWGTPVSGKAWQKQLTLKRVTAGAFG